MQSPPLAELYDLLRADGLAIGVDDHIRIGRLLARDAAWTLEMLRISIAALVVTDPHERAAFDACWERWVQSTATPDAPEALRPPLAAQKPRLARWVIVISGAIAIAVALGVAMRPHVNEPLIVPAIDAAIVNTPPIDADAGPEAPPIDAGEQSPIDAGSDPKVPPIDAGKELPLDARADRKVSPIDAGEELPLDAPATYPLPERPPPPLRTASDLALVGLMFGVIMLVSAAIAGATRARARRRFLPGPWRYALAVPPATKPVLPRSAIEDAAADLTWEAPDTGHELDVARSVVATVARGGLPTLVYRRPVSVPRYLVLEDTAGGAERWRFVYDELLRGLTREGIEIERYTFAANLEQCTGSDGRPVALGDLLDHADALIAIGDGDAAVDALSGDRADWLVTLHCIPRRLWINPFPPARWSAGAHAIAADTPMEHGVARALAAMRVGVDRQVRPNSAYPAVIERTPGTASAIVALRTALGNRAFRLVAAVSVVGPPTISLARWLAEVHELELDEQDWLCVVTLPWFQTEQWPAGGRDRLSHALGSEVPDLSLELAASSDRLLSASEPPRDSGAHLAWQLDRAYRDGLRGERGVAARALNRIAGTPLANQARGLLAALGLRDRSRVALVSAIVVGAALVAGAGGYSIVETQLQSAALERRVSERHLEKLAGEGAQLPAPTGSSWPEVFVVRVIDGNGNPVSNARVVWSDPQLGSRSYIGTTDADGLSRATQVYSSSPRDDLSQVAQLIAIWNGETFTDKPVPADGEKVVFHFTQSVGVPSANAEPGPDSAAVAPDAQMEDTTSDAGSGVDASLRADDTMKQSVVCSDLVRQRAWLAVINCATALEKGGERDKAQKLYAKAEQEIRNRNQANLALQAIHNGDLKATLELLRGIDGDSVYLAEVRDAFAKAESQPAIDLWNPAARKPGCDVPNVDEALQNAAVQYNNGFSSTALSIVIRALNCKQSIHMFQLAVLYACGARDLKSAKYYFAYVPQGRESGLEQRCQQEGLNLRGL